MSYGASEWGRSKPIVMKRIVFLDDVRVSACFPNRPVLACGKCYGASGSTDMAGPHVFPAGETDRRRAALIKETWAWSAAAAIPAIAGSTFLSRHATAKVVSRLPGSRWLIG